MFVDDKNYIKVTVYFKTGKEHRGIRVETSLDKIAEDKRSEYTTVIFDMKPITWKMSNDLMRECRSKNMATGMDEIDWITYKERKLRLTVAGWDAKDDKGVAVPMNEAAIMRLHPLVAETVLSLYDKESYLEDEVKL